MASAGGYVSQVSLHVDEATFATYMAAQRRLVEADVLAEAAAAGEAHCVRRATPQRSRSSSPPKSVRRPRARGRRRPVREERGRGSVALRL